MTDTQRPIVKTTSRVEQYLGARALVTTEHHDSKRLGLRTVTMAWLDTADAANGGHRAGTIVRSVVDGDAWRGPHFETIEVEAKVGRMGAAERRALMGANPRRDIHGRAFAEAATR